MLAGAPPLMGPTAQAVLARRVSEPVPHISTLCEAVSPQLDAVIARALACLPADRFTTAAEFARAMQSAGLDTRVTVRERLAARLSLRGAPDDARPRWRVLLPRPLWQRRVVIGMSGVAVIAGALLAIRSGWVAWHRSRDAGLDPRRVILTPFENQTGEASLNNVGEISVDWLIRELQSTELVQVIDERSLVSTERDGRPARDASFARNAHAGTMVSVAFYRLADSLAFRVRITETATGKRLYTSHPITAPVVSPLAGLDELSQDLVGAVITLVAPGVEWHADATRPPSLMAYKQFMAGLALLPSLDFDGATQHWFQAARIDTTFVTPLLSAASFMLVWGQNARADSLISSIRPRREWLQVSERHRLDNLSARLRGNIPVALAALQPLAQAAPASEAAWEYALHELWLNRPREATAAFAQLDPAWEFLHGWWFYWVFYCDAYHMGADFSAELTVARRGRIQYPNSIRVAEPELQALAALGRIDALDKVLAGVSAMPREEPADRVEGQALPRVLMVAAQELRAHGHEEASARLLQRAQDLTKSWPSSGQTSAPGWLPAMISYLSGRWEEAQERYSELAARDSTDLNVQGHLGVIAARRGDRAEALRISAWIEGLDRPYLYGYDTLWRARIAALLGEDERAMDLLRVAFGQGLKFVGTFVGDAPARTWGPWLHRDIDFESLRHSPAWQDLMQGQY
jgi:tetratricopeptide (TPR) repeat protein